MLDDLRDAFELVATRKVVVQASFAGLEPHTQFTLYHGRLCHYLSFIKS